MSFVAGAPLHHKRGGRKNGYSGGLCVVGYSFIPVFLLRRSLLDDGILGISFLHGKHLEHWLLFVNGKPFTPYQKIPPPSFLLPSRPVQIDTYSNGEYNQANKLVSEMARGDVWNGTCRRLRSMRYLMDEHPEVNIGIIFSSMSS